MTRYAEIHTEPFLSVKRGWTLEDHLVYHLKKTMNATLRQHADLKAIIIRQQNFTRGRMPTVAESRAFIARSFSTDRKTSAARPLGQVGRT